MTVTKKTMIALCPGCEGEINFSQYMPKQGEKLMCPHCEAYLVVVRVKPLEIDWDEDGYDTDNWDVSED